jgi:tetratricopeptide (TPR) repeat protein
MNSYRKFLRSRTLEAALLLCALLSTSIATKIRAQFVLQSGRVDELIRRGEDLNYDMQFDAANRTFDSVIAIDPTFPAGYFYKAVVIFWRTTTNTDNTKLDDEYNRYLQLAIDRCDTMLAKNDQSYPAIFYKGAALGYHAMILSQRQSFMSSIGGILDDAHQGNSDVLVVRGLYNYYVEQIKQENPALSPVIGLFATGNKRIGLVMLEEAAKSAVYSRVEAQFQLADIYERYEKNHVRANAFAQHLVNLYPHNVEFLQILGSSQVALGLTSNYDSTYRVILDRSRNRVAGYTIKQARGAMYYIGQAEMIRPGGNIDSALWFLYNSDLLSRKMSPDETNGWIIKAELLMGEAYDMKGMRDRATEMYKRVMDLQTSGDDHNTAANFLHTPYRR